MKATGKMKQLDCKKCEDVLYIGRNLFEFYEERGSIRDTMLHEFLSNRYHPNKHVVYFRRRNNQKIVNAGMILFV